MLGQNDTMRRLGLGDFGPLAHAMVVDPAMLIWLDGNDNTAKAPNENLAREFMELFSLGHGSYSETDVKEAARALTGWKINRQNGEVMLRPGLHDDGSKTLLGTTADLGAQDFVDVVLGQPASAEFVVGRLWARLVSTETPPPRDVKETLLDAYGPGRSVTAVLTAMMNSAPFRAAGTSLVKQPVEWLVGLCRALGVRPSQLSELQQKRLVGGLRGMGQVPFRPPSVGGWPAAGGWLTTASALARMNTARLLVAASGLVELEKSSAKTRAEDVRRLLGVDRFSTRTTNAIADRSPIVRGRRRRASVPPPPNTPSPPEVMIMKQPPSRPESARSPDAASSPSVESPRPARWRSVRPRSAGPICSPRQPRPRWTRRPACW